MGLDRLQDYKPNTVQRIALLLLLVYALRFSDIPNRAVNWTVDNLSGVSPILVTSGAIAVGVLAAYSTFLFVGKKTAEKRNAHHRWRWYIWGLAFLPAILLGFVALIDALV